MWKTRTSASWGVRLLGLLLLMPACGSRSDILEGLSLVSLGSGGTGWTPADGDADGSPGSGGTSSAGGATGGSTSGGTTAGTGATGTQTGGPILPVEVCESCDVHAWCDRTGAQVRCECQAGWAGDGMLCSPMIGERPPVRATQVVIGESHNCVLTEEGTVFCSGEAGAEGAPPRSQNDFIQLAAGTFHTCGLRANGSISCWPPAAMEDPPVGRFQQVTCGSGYSCALEVGGAMACWGNVPHSRRDPGPFTQIAAGVRQNGDVRGANEAGGRHTCGLTEGGQASCRGTPEFGSPDASANFTSIAAAGVDTCGVTPEGVGTCWNVAGPRNLFADVTQVVIGQYIACGLHSKGDAECRWLPSGEVIASPKDVAFESIACGNACAGVTVDGDVRFWDQGTE